MPPVVDGLVHLSRVVKGVACNRVKACVLISWLERKSHYGVGGDCDIVCRGLDVRGELELDVIREDT